MDHVINASIIIEIDISLESLSKANFGICRINNSQSDSLRTVIKEDVLGIDS